ncbi:MAG: hypothetical protein NZL95_06045 [Chitinophagales bacterium]|nr:hypothetical protein [Chitinophagales bacterium]MDW8428097.1 hypothetical protein [Chitinophagales bacterium]
MIGTLRKVCFLLARISFFIVYFYFGLLKVLGHSPAEAIVHELWLRTISIIPFKTFVLLFGAFEMLLGVIFLIPGLERIALYLLIPHFITTFGPLVLLPHLTWKGFMVPTLAGHYVIKNITIIALAILIAANIGRFEKRQIPHETKLDNGA